MSIHPNDRITIAHHLEELANRVNGVVDFWTVVCLSETLPERLAFLDQQADRLKSLRLSIESLLRDQTNQEQLDLLQAIAQHSDQLHQSVLVLARFREEAPEAVRVATEQLKSAYHNLLASILTLSRSLGCPVPAVEGQSWERQEYYERILDGLLNRFLTARTSGQVIAP